MGGWQGVHQTGTLSKSASVCVAHIPVRSLVVAVEPLPSSSAPPPPDEAEEFKVGERVRRRLRGRVIDALPANSESMCQPMLLCEIKGRLYVGAAEPRRSVVGTTYSVTQKAGALPAHGRNLTRANEAARDKKKKSPTTFCHRFKSAQSLGNTTSCCWSFDDSQ